MQQPASNLTSDEIDRLRAAVSRLGQRSVSARLGVSRHTIDRLLAQLACRVGSVHVVRSQLTTLYEGQS